MGLVPLVEKPEVELLIVYVMEVAFAPPDHVAINPVLRMDEEARDVMAVGGGYVVAEPVTLPPALVAVITSTQLVVAGNPVNVVGLVPLVENPVPEPLIV